MESTYTLTIVHTKTNIHPSSGDISGGVTPQFVSGHF